MEISRVNVVKFIARAWGKTRFNKRIAYAQEPLTDYVSYIQVDRTWGMYEWLYKQKRRGVHTRAHSISRSDRRRR